MTYTNLIQDVENVLSENTKYPIHEDAVPSLIDNWAIAKRKYIDAFDGQLTVRSNDLVTVERDKVELEHIFGEFLSDLGIFRLYNSSIDTEEIRAFLNEQGYESFFENKVVSDYTTSNNKVIRKGAKISRSLKHFVPDTELLDKLQTKYSMILQDLRITGYLYISVHPLDYLSISETNHNWHSCHSLDGEYASGNINYLTDSTTVVAYLATDDKQKLRNFGDVEWNSKKWRMLFYVSEDNQLIAGSKNYPFKSLDFTSKCFVKLQNILGGSWSELEEIKDKDMAMTYMYDAEDTVHFNDCLLSSSYRGWISLTEDWNGYKIEVGEPFYCLECGNSLVTIGGTDFACSECSEILECGCCGYGVSYDEVIECHGEYYCEDCAWDILIYCEDCCRYYHPDYDSVVYNEEHCAYYCEECAEGYIEDEV